MNKKKNDNDNEMMCNEKSATMKIMKINQKQTYIKEEEKQRENIGDG
jgi:hypothetical protein